MKSSFSRVVIDVPAGLSTTSLAAIRAADRVLVVTTYTIDAIARLKQLMAELMELPGYPAKFPVILNRRGSSVDVSLPEREAVPTRVLARLENNNRVPRSLKQGYCWLSRHKRSALSRSLRELAARLTGAEDRLKARAAFLSAWFPFRETNRGRQSSPIEAVPPPAARGFFRQRRGKARLALGEALYLDGRFFKAFQELRRAVDDDPTLSKAYQLLGEISLSLARRREATTYFEAALRSEPGNLKALANYAVLQRGRELLASCRRRLAESIEANPTWPDLHCMIGFVNMGLADTKTAIWNFTEALRLNPGYAEAYRGLGDLYVQQRKNTQAVELYLKALGANPGDVPARYGLARVYRALGLLAPAADTFAEVTARCPHHGTAQHETLVLHEALELLNDEIRSLEHSLEINPDFSDNLSRLGEAYTRKGLYDKAIRCFKRALRFNPDMLAAKESLLRVKAIRERVVRGQARLTGA